MKVTIAVPGVFHAFELGAQLESRNALETIHTTYPRFGFDAPGVPADKIRTVPYAEAIMWAGGQVPLIDRIVPSKWAKPTQRWKNALFDRVVAHRLDPPDGDGIFLGFAGCSLRSLRRANELGYTTAVERSSAHIRTQARILTREYERYGFEPPISETMIAYEEREYRAADYIITPSSFVAESFRDQGIDPDRVKRVPLGTDLPSAPEPTSGSDRFRFLFSGYVGLRKGVPYLLEAWDSLDLPNAELVLTSGIDDTMEDIIAPYREADDVRFLGWVEDLDACYADASTFVFPSLEDGFGRVVVEAMARRLPVIVTESTGAKDCVEEGHSGHVVPSADPDTLAARMRERYDDPDETQEMGKNARRTIANRYTWDDYGDRIHETYQGLLESE